MKFLLKTIIILIVFISCISLGLAGVAGWYIYFGDYSKLKKSTILSKIHEETTLYYLDEKTRIGSIFTDIHRRYVSIDDIPAHMINAIVAAEDKNYYHHFGVDPTSILQAFVEGVLSGWYFRRGGSTISQQTVKNIVDDWEASFARKFRELIRAIQLERLYTKRQILEFYLNQFHVVGNGNGIGIASRYYFNKDVRTLNLVESAFIAGSVKGPGKYNPFIKYTRKAKKLAVKYANQRKNYVLKRMYEQGWISADEYKGAKAKKVVFARGEFRSSEVALVNLVQDQLKKPEVIEALGLRSPYDLNVAGLKVYTTLDYKMQKAAQLVMRRNLSRLEYILQDFRVENPKKFKPQRSLKVNQFVFGRISKITKDRFNKYQIYLSYGLPTGRIPTASLVRTAKLLDLAGGKGYKHYLEDMISNIKVGDILYGEVTAYNSKSHQATIELRRYPKISGGLIALEKGQVRAVISGFDTLGYNRAMVAKRQPGSVAKSLLFFTALQLGWSVLDQIDNFRKVFPFQGRYYYPRPDHRSPYDRVSMLWGGIMSENLAAVDLGASLVAKADFAQFKKLMSMMQLLPDTGESEADYHYRVARKIGVSLNDEGIRSQQLLNAVNDLEPDLVFAGKKTIQNRLQQLWWGDNYEEELLRLIAQYSPRMRAFSLKELITRIDLIRNNMVRITALEKSLQVDWQLLRNFFVKNSFNLESTLLSEEFKRIIARFRVITSVDGSPQLSYDTTLETENWPQNINVSLLVKHKGRKLSLLDIKHLWANSPLNDQGSVVDINNVSLAGYLPVYLFHQLRERSERSFQELITRKDSYKIYHYYQHHDFRIALGLNYMITVSKIIGINSKLEPVLSFPLGTSDVTVADIAKSYQTMSSGKIYRYFKDGTPNQLSFIRRIEDRFGHVLYQLDPKINQIVSMNVIFQMREMLRKTITHGTGRRARGELYVPIKISNKKNKVTNIRIPALGKTGTTNDFVTSYFAGLLPHPAERSGDLSLDNSYTIAAYVGYDLNRTMRNGRQRIYGGVGALPVWTDLAKEIIVDKKYRNYIDTLDFSVLSKKEWPLWFSNDTKPVYVDLPRGLVLRYGDSLDFETWKTTNFSTTGESFYDIFAIDHKVSSVVYLPGDIKTNTWQPYKSFAPMDVSWALSQQDKAVIASGNPSK